MADIYGDFSGLSPILQVFLQFPLWTHINLNFTAWKKLDVTTEKEDGHHITSPAQKQDKRKTPFSVYLFFIETLITISPKIQKPCMLNSYIYSLSDRFSPCPLCAKPCLRTGESAVS